MRTVRATVPSWGVDTIAIPTAAEAANVRAAGASFWVGYLGHMTAEALAVILAAGMAFAPIGGFSRYPGWEPSAALGASDASDAIAWARALGVPTGATIWCDYEEPGGTVDDSTAYLVAWSHAIKAAGFVPGLYVGAGCPLDALALYALPCEAYWHSCSVVPDVAVCGYQMLQNYPPNQLCGGVLVDFNYILGDRAGRLPILVAA